MNKYVYVLKCKKRTDIYSYLGDTVEYNLGIFSNIDDVTMVIRKMIKRTKKVIKRDPDWHIESEYITYKRNNNLLYEYYILCKDDFSFYSYTYKIIEMKLYQ